MIDDGNVTITLNEEELILKPTLNACLELSRKGGGIISIQDRILKFDLDAYCTIIAVGTGQKVNKKLQTSVYQNGMSDLAEPLINFTNIVANGGKPLPGNDESDEETSDPK